MCRWHRHSSRRGLVNEKAEMVRYNLALLLPHRFSADKGRVLGFDNAHGTHERHYTGEVKPVKFRGYLATASASIEILRCSGEAMKTKVFHDGFEGHVRRSLERAAKREKGSGSRLREQVNPGHESCRLSSLSHSGSRCALPITHAANLSHSAPTLEACGCQYRRNQCAH